MMDIPPFTEIPDVMYKETIPYYIGLSQREAYEANRTARQLWNESVTSGELLAKVASVANTMKEATYIAFVIGSKLESGKR